jgi:hypothetical protein
MTAHDRAFLTSLLVVAIACVATIVLVVTARPVGDPDPVWTPQTIAPPITTEVGP